MQYYFINEVYQNLLGILQEIDLESGTTYANTFAGFFGQDATTGNWICNNVSGYQDFLKGLFDGEDYSDSDFLAWGIMENITSTQGGGTQ